MLKAFKAICSMIRLTSEQMFSELIRTKRLPSLFSVSEREVPNIRGYVVSTMNCPVLEKEGWRDVHWVGLNLHVINSNW